MTWIQSAVSVIAALVALAGVVWLWIEHRGRKVFSTLDQFHGLKVQVIEMDQCQIKTRTLAEKNRDHIALLEQDRKYQAERMSEMVVKPLERVVERLEGITTVLNKHGEQLAVLEAGDRSLGRSLDQLRDEIHRERGQEKP